MVNKNAALHNSNKASSKTIGSMAKNIEKNDKGLITSREAGMIVRNMVESYENKLK